MAAATAKQRVVWVDIAKGISIILVVFLHAAIFGIDRKLAPGLWYDISTAGEHLRLPLFFMVSGLFAAKIRTFTFAELFVKRIYLWGVPFILWGAIVLLASHWIRDTSLATFWADWAHGFMFPNNGIWFLMALIVYSFVVWCLRKVRGRYVLAFSTILTVVVPFLGSPSPNDLWWSWRRLCMYFFCYCLGLYARDIVIKISRNARWYHAVILFAVLATAEHYYPELQANAQSALNVIYIVLGLVTGVSIAVSLDGTYVGRGLAYLGKHTLEIYLLNEILVWVFFLHVMPSLGAVPSSELVITRYREAFTNSGNVLQNWVFWSPIICTLLVCFVGLFLRNVVRGSKVDWVFTPPTFGWMTRWVERSKKRQTARIAQTDSVATDEARHEVADHNIVISEDPGDVDPAAELRRAEEDRLSHD